MRTRRISCRVTEEEYAMIEAYCKVSDHIDVAALVRHAVFGHMRRDKRRVPERYSTTLGLDILP